MEERRKQQYLEELSRPELVGKPNTSECTGMDRATFLKQVISSGVILGGITLFAGCSSGESDASTDSPESGSGTGDEPTGSTRGKSDPSDCGDLSGLSTEEREKRDLYGYVEESSFPDSRCENCSLYLPSDEERGCGGCILFSGPVFAEAYCDYWAPIPEG